MRISVAYRAEQGVWFLLGASTVHHLQLHCKLLYRVSALLGRVWSLAWFDASVGRYFGSIGVLHILQEKSVEGLCKA